MNRKTHTLVFFALAALFLGSCQKENGVTGTGPSTPYANYNLQSVPNIGEWPEDLVKEMAAHLHFGDNPPRIDTCFHTPRVYLHKHINNGVYYKPPQEFPYSYAYKFHNQHGSVFDMVRFKVPITVTDQYSIFAETTTRDSVFIMGNGDYFTAYYKIKLKLSTWAQNPGMNDYLKPLNGKELKESVILSGKALNKTSWMFRFTKKDNTVINTYAYTIDTLNGKPFYLTESGETIWQDDTRYLDTIQTTLVTGISDVHIGVRVENAIEIPGLDFFAKHDILLYSCSGDLTIDPEFFEGNNKSKP